MKRTFLTGVLFSIAVLFGSRLPAGLRRAEAASAAQAGNRHAVIDGYIGDSMCGLHHGKAATSPAEERACTIQCVHDGSKFILADRTNRKVYELDDQIAPRRFAGKKVRVTGKVDGQSVQVEGIEPTE